MAHITTQLLAVVLVSLATCARGQRVYQRAPPYHFFYPPQRGYVQQVPAPVRQLQNAPAFTQTTVYVVVEDDGSGGPNGDAEQRRLLDAIPSLLEMLSTGGAGASYSPGSSPPPSPGRDLQPTTAPKTVFLDDVEPEFDKGAWQQGEAGQEAAAAAPAVPADEPTQDDDATPSPPLEYPKDSSDTRPDYATDDDPPIDVRSGFTGGKSRTRVNPREPTS